MNNFLKALLIILVFFSGIVAIHIFSGIFADWGNEGIRFLKRANQAQITAIIIFIIYALHRFSRMKKK